MTPTTGLETDKAIIDIVYSLPQVFECSSERTSEA